MRTIIAGSRGVGSVGLVAEAVEAAGTHDMIERAKAHGLRIYVHKCETRSQRALRLFLARRAGRK